MDRRQQPWQTDAKTLRPPILGHGRARSGRRPRWDRACDPYALGPDVKVSTPSTLIMCPFGASPDFAAHVDNTEVEPQVAVNPTTPG
jgi:hypothetical protein